MPYYSFPRSTAALFMLHLAFVFIDRVLVRVGCSLIIGYPLDIYWISTGYSLNYY